MCTLRGSLDPGASFIIIEVDEVPFARLFFALTNIPKGKSHNSNTVHQTFWFGGLRY